MKKTVCSVSVLMATLFLPMVGFAHAAQEAPAPQRSPRVPVHSESLADPTETAAANPAAARQISGPATILDGEKLHIGTTDMRLFGIVPPQLSASYGPQARSALDGVVGTQNVTCVIRDRDREGRLMATCQTAGGTDLALELIKRGLAVTARGSLSGTELSATYLAAEQSAQAQKLGLWSVPPVAAPAAGTQPVLVAASAAPVSSNGATAPGPHISEKSTEKVSEKTSAVEPQVRLAAAVIDQNARARIEEVAWNADDRHGFFERYQILIAGLLMFITALGITSAYWIQKGRERRSEMRAVAAALRGELMAARGICLGRLKTLATDGGDDSAVSWPRIRATLYGAYVGRLGLLGAELSRQVASIYGQASDYAALYNPSTGASVPAATETPKKSALETLVRNIDEVLPKLASIELGGMTTSAALVRAAPVVTSPQGTMPTPSRPSQPRTSPTLITTSGLGEMQHEARREDTVMRVEEKVVLQKETPPPKALWGSVRGLIQNRADEVEYSQHDAEVGEYTAIIEAEMARYQYSEQYEPLDVPPGKQSRS